MIRGLRANKPTFRSVVFTQGFNLVLADRTASASQRDSRNGVGKSTLIELIHFGLGSSGKWQGMEALAGWTFTLDIEVNGHLVSATRTIGDNKLRLDGALGALPGLEDAGQGTVVSVEDWCRLLGAAWFGLPPEGNSGIYQPTFRSLISFLIRRAPEAYVTPFEHARKMQDWDRQVNNAHLMGLPWDVARQWQLSKDKKKVLQTIKKAASEGYFGEIMSSAGLLPVAQLQADHVRLAERARREGDSLRSFRVHPQYTAIQEEANRLTKRMHDIANANLTQSRTVDLYMESFETEQGPSIDAVLQLYQDAGVTLPGAVVARLQDVRTFHERIVKNRRDFLEQEITRLTAAIRDGERALEKLTNERAEKLETLQSHGALEEYSRLQDRYAKTRAMLQQAEERLAKHAEFNRGKSELRIEQENLRVRAAHELDDAAAQRAQAIRLFNANSEALYEAPGTLLIEVGDTGFQYNVEIERAGSHGVSKMKVFCYDLMLAQLWASKRPSPRLLVHDSIIFDGVDERQMARALRLAAEASAKSGFQYILTMNTDVVPTKELGDFPLDDFVRLRLTDTDPAGSLLGIRY